MAVLTKLESEHFLDILKNRFNKNMLRHENLDWTRIQNKLEQEPEKMWTLKQMEDTGGEPDVIYFREQENEITFIDCSVESPSGRRSFCYDEVALNARKENKPKNSAIAFAKSIKASILTENHYRKLQEFGNFDSKTSSWIETPAKIRKLGGALFADFRYDTVFVYHNGVQSYYAARGLRCYLTL